MIYSENTSPKNLHKINFSSPTYKKIKNKIDKYLILESDDSLDLVNNLINNNLYQANDIDFIKTELEFVIDKYSTEQKLLTKLKKNIEKYVDNSKNSNKHIENLKNIEHLQSLIDFMESRTKISYQHIQTINSLISHKL